MTLPDLDGNPATTNDIATYGYQYDARGNMVQLTDPLGRDTRFTFNNQGQQLTRTLPLGFGADGMFGTADDLPPLPPGEGWGEGRFTETMQYDTKGRKILETSFEGVITEYLYDDGLHGTGQLYQKKFYASEAAFNAGTVKETQTMSFDAFGREISTLWTSTGEPGGVSPRSDMWTNQFDLQGRLLSVASPTGTVFYEYDVVGRQTRVMSRGVGFQPANSTDYETDIHYSYDPLSRLSKVETFERNNVAVDVDPNTAGNQPETESYAYTLNGNLDYEINPDGSTTDYTYDELNRLTDLDEYRASTTTPDIFTDNPKLAEYNYTLRNDGKKESADEIIYATDGTTPVSHTQFDWTYDHAGRLTDEVFTDVGDLLHFPSPGGEGQGEGAAVDNYHAAFEYDLTGNRLTQTNITDTNHDGVLNAAVDRDEVTTYTSDANDRMLSESTVVDGAATESTAYGFTGTQQTSKSVVSQISNNQISNQLFTYNLQGRMSDVVSTTFNPTTGTPTRIDTIGYRYGTDGIRISARQEIDTNADGNIDSVENTEYLIDAHNHTGYQQVLQETVTDANGNLIKKIVYTIGLDHISQTTFAPGGPVQGTTAVFHMDGHGSTRILTDLAGAILNIGGFAQIYHYTAYGEAINFQMANAATQYLYSGEQFDARTGQQYLRARYYNQANGTFNRLDPFFGNQSNPQSFHKYLYTHGDPMNGWDPTGMENLGSLSVTNGMSSSMISTHTLGTLAWRGAIVGAFLGGLRAFSDSVTNNDKNAWDVFVDTMKGAGQGAAMGILFAALTPVLSSVGSVAVITALAGLGIGGSVINYYKVQEALARQDYDNATVRTVWGVFDAVMSLIAIGGATSAQSPKSGSPSDYTPANGFRGTNGERLNGARVPVFFRASVEVLLKLFKIDVSYKESLPADRPGTLATGKFFGSPTATGRAQIWLLKDPTWKEMMHEFTHAMQYLALGREKFDQTPINLLEQSVIQMTKLTFWGFLNEAEQASVLNHPGAH